MLIFQLLQFSSQYHTILNNEAQCKVFFFMTLRISRSNVDITGSLYFPVFDEIFILHILNNLTKLAINRAHNKNINKNIIIIKCN